MADSRLRAGVQGKPVSSGEKGSSGMRVHVDVTADDIANGARLDCFACPIALAMKRATDAFLAIGANYVEFASHSVRLPREVSDFVFDFDGGYEVQPFSFDLELS